MSMCSMIYGSKSNWWSKKSALIVGVFSLLTLGSAMAATSSTPASSLSGGVYLPVQHVAAPNPGETQQSDLERQISNLEGQWIDLKFHNADASAYLPLKTRLNELYAQRHENPIPSRHLDQGGDACSNATVIPGLPYTDTGTTAGMVDNFTPGCVNFGAAPDVIYQFTPIATGNYTISTCGSSFDTELTLRSGGSCPGSNIINCNDDACGVQSTIVTALTGGQTYWIIVDGYNGGAWGTYTLNITDDCSVPCQAGDIAEAAENPADPNFSTTDPDGGCNLPVPSFGSISCGTTVCGYGFTYGSGLYDVDWYRFTLTGWDTVTFTVRAEFPIAAIITQNNCAGTMVYNQTGPCQTMVLSVNCLPAGTYLFACAPLVSTGLGIPRPYRVTMNCGACPVGRCCYSNTCATNLNSECNTLGGQWRGDVSCERHPCMPAPNCTPESDFAQLPSTPFGWGGYVSERWAGATCAQRFLVPSNNIGHIRFWGLYSGDTTFVPVNAPFHVEFRLDSSGVPASAAYFAQDLQITGTAIDAYNPGVGVYTGYQFDSDIQLSGITNGWIIIQSTGSAPQGFYWLTALSGNNQAEQLLGGHWSPLNVSLSLCLSAIVCDPVTQTCPGKIIPSTLPYTDRGNTSCSSLQVTDCAYGFFQMQYDLYRFIPTSCQTVTVDLCGSLFDTELEVRTGGDCPGTTSVACNDDYCGSVNGHHYNSQVSFVAMAGQTYYFLVGGLASNTGAFVLHVNGVPWLMPNDACPGTAITTLPFTDSGNTFCANNDVTWSCPYAGNPDANDVMYSMTLSTCQQVTASLCGSGYDTGIEVRTGGACPGSTTVACNDDHSCSGGNGFQSQVSFDALPGVTYYILVDGYYEDAGPFTLNVTGIPCPDPAVSHLVILPQFPSNHLHWQHVPNAVQYSVYRGGTFNFPLDAAHFLATTADTFYVDAGILNTADVKDFYVITCISAPPPALVMPPMTLEMKKAARAVSYEGPAIVIPMFNEERAPANKQALVLPQQK